MKQNSDEEYVSLSLIDISKPTGGNEFYLLLPTIVKVEKTMPIVPTVMMGEGEGVSGLQLGTEIQGFYINRGLKLVLKDGTTSGDDLTYFEMNSNLGHSSSTFHQGIEPPRALACCACGAV